MHENDNFWQFLMHSIFNVYESTMDLIEIILTKTLPWWSRYLSGILQTRAEQSKAFEFAFQLNVNCLHLLSNRIIFLLNLYEYYWRLFEFATYVEVFKWRRTFSMRFCWWFSMMSLSSSSGGASNKHSILNLNEFSSFFFLFSKISRFDIKWVT